MEEEEKEDNWVEEKGKQGENRGGEVSCLELRAKHPREPRDTDMNTKPSPALPIHSSTPVFLLKCGASSSHLRAESMTLLHRYIGRSTQNPPAVQVDVRDAGGRKRRRWT